MVGACPTAGCLTPTKWTAVDDDDEVEVDHLRSFVYNLFYRFFGWLQCHADRSPNPSIVLEHKKLHTRWEHNRVRAHEEAACDRECAFVLVCAAVSGKSAQDCKNCKSNCACHKDSHGHANGDLRRPQLFTRKGKIFCCFSE